MGEERSESRTTGEGLSRSVVGSPTLSLRHNTDKTV